MMRTRILRGRGFDDGDRAGAPPVVVVSAAMGRALWPGQDPLGRCIEVTWGPDGPASNGCSTVIGIAEDAAQQGLLDQQRFMYYLNVNQIDPGGASTLYLRMRGSDIERDLERVRRELQAVMPGDGYVEVRPLQEVVDDQRRSWQLGATLFAAFGVLALVVAAVGLYGVITYSVSQRLHELGVRIALGARAGHIVRLVVAQGLGYAAAGVAVGLALAAVASRWVEPLLYRASGRDPVTYGAVAALMMVVGLVAGAVPSIRAVRADPNRALRVD